MQASSGPDAGLWRFLYRTDEGRIDAGTWRGGAAVLLAVLGLLTLILFFVLPYAKHDLSKTPLLSISALSANLYVIVYSFALILIGICYYNLSAKRWRDIGRPPALAGLLPFLALLTGAAHWLSWRLGDAVPNALPLIADACFILAVCWNVIELGGLIPKRQQRD